MLTGIKLDPMYLKMYIKPERFYRNPENQTHQEVKCFPDFNEDFDDRELTIFLFILNVTQTIQHEIQCKIQKIKNLNPNDSLNDRCEPHAKTDSKYKFKIRNN